MPPDSGDARSRRLRRRRIVLIAVVALALVASIGGLLIATTIKSPAEQAAQSAPPALTQLSVPVTRQVITGTVLAQGLVKPPPEVAQLSGANTGAGSGELSVVTKIFARRGSYVQPGQVIVEVAGRPLFVFPGAYPPTGTSCPARPAPTSPSSRRAWNPSATRSAGHQRRVRPGHRSRGRGLLHRARVFRADGPRHQRRQRTGAKTSGAHGAKHPPQPMVPLSEIMFVPRFPARVVKVAGPVGSVASGSLVTLSMGNPSVAGQLSPSDAALVRAGMAVTITDPATGLTRRGHLGSVGLRTQTKKQHFRRRVRADEDPPGPGAARLAWSARTSR